MIKKILDIFPIFGKKDVDITEKYLQESLVLLAIFDESLPKRTLDYVLTGKNPEILFELNKLDAAKAAVYFHRAGTLEWWYASNIDTGKYSKVITQGLNARHKLYSKVGESFSLEQVARYAKVIAAACQDINIKVTTTEVPTWVIYLLVDAFYTTYDNARNLNLEHRKHWSMEFIANMVEAEANIPGENALFAVFDRKDISEYYASNLKRIYELSDLKDYLLSHQEFIRTELIDKLSANGLVELINHLNKNTILRDTFADIIVLLATSSLKTVKKAAEPILNTLPAEIVKENLTHVLMNGTPKQRTQAADLFARQGENRDVLEEALKHETSKAVIKSIESALQRFSVADNANTVDAIETPDFTPLEDTPLPDSTRDIMVNNFNEMLAKAKENAEREIEENKTSKHSYNWAQRHYKDLSKIDEKQCRALVDKLNSGQGTIQSNEIQIIKHKNRIPNLPEYTFFHAVRVITNNRQHADHFSSHYFNGDIPERLFSDIELRQVENVLERCSFKHAARVTAALCLESYQDGLRRFRKPEQVWPFFSQHTDYIAEALNLMPNQSEHRYRQFEISQGIEVLGRFPTIPAQFVPRIMELALGENKTHRVSAQKLLETLPNIHLSAQEGLTSSKQEIRVTAIEWLARLNNPDSLPALNALLKKEKREVVRASLLTALEQLGEDISSYLSPKTLLAEAEKGLKAKAPASLAWFNFEAIPALTWENKKAVDPAIIRWWIILAVKLKMPGGNALLQRYIGLLSTDSQHKLSSFILHTFVAQDIKGPSLEEAMVEAQREAPGRLSNYQNWAKRYPEYYAKYENYTLEQVIEEIKNEVLRRYLGSAISDKGMLALICGIEGHVAVSVLRNYMRDHYQRRAQIEAMIDAVASSNDPIIIQLLLSLSRRYRTASVQEKARNLVTQIAERNGWSADELADRTIPTAGFDDTGTLVLEYGERIFTAKMDAKQKLVLFNPEGKEVKALPAARKNDDAELIKEAKKLFTSSKKELKQVIELQSVRLYEAMCAQRQWLSADWQEYILAHPIMHKLIEQLVWQEVKDGKVINTFRPSDDGALLDLEDDEVTLQNDSLIQLAHAALVNEDERKAWIAHFKDYKIKFLFSQMEHKIPELDLKQTEVEDRKGWITDTFTLRGILTKMGYQRGPAEDGGSFSHYYKFFSSLNYYVNIGFSGSYVPEENIPAVLFDLSFEKNQQDYWGRNNVELKNVPPILLAESYADYLKVAEACAGFDPEWEKKTPW
ncbi:DUF4132 domain-containing protein [Proteus terrae]|uniref:DUF4132 domain-containing protein n=1 Tax=Proteus terrae TaxID=1574161 RepID=UPI000D68EDA2|nr:DUF4132 domain-containing protein [Proteus terrae]